MCDTIANRAVWAEGDSNRSALRQQFVNEWPDAKAREILASDANGFMHQALSTPCLNAIERAAGIFLIDTAGRRIMDFHGNGVHHLGFAHPKLIAAMQQQASTLPFSTRRFANAPAAQLAERLGDLTGGVLTKVLLSPAGALAIGTALKVARLTTGRYKTISMRGSFHGASLDAIAVGGQDEFKAAIGPMPPGAMLVPPPAHAISVADESADLIDGSLKAIAAIFEEHDDIAAVVAEPIRWTSVELPAVVFWRRVRDLCTQHGALLIFDEIGTGLGRTGCMFAYQHYGVEPDIVCLGKALGGGLFPLAATLVRPELDCAPHLSLGHYTHEKSPVGSAIALALLDCLEQERVLQHVRQLEAEVLEQLHRLARRCPAIQSVRGIGAMYALELGDTEAHDANVLAERVMYTALRNGLSFKVTAGWVLTLTPPLIISSEQMQTAIEILTSALDEAIQ